MQQVLSSKRPSFLQRSASITSLVAWKERFEAYSGKFTRKPSFISHVSRNGVYFADTKLIKEGISNWEPEYNPGPENDLPPGYQEATMMDNTTGHVDDEPPPQLEKKPSFGQDFTALETYLKKKLSIRKKSGCRLQDTQLETAKVFQWLNELPEGDNLEEFLEAYGLPTKGVDIEELKDRLRLFLSDKLTESDNSTGEVDANKIRRSLSEEMNDDPRWQRQISNLEELAHGDNLEKWLESLDVPYFKPIPETKNEIRKYLKLQIQDELDIIGTPPQPEPKVQLPVTPPPNYEDIAAFVPKWQELIDKMRNLKNEDDLDNWLESLEIPHSVQKEKVKAEIRKFFMHENFENFAGKSLLLQDHTLAKELWNKFEDSSTLKQVAMISGTTAVLGLIAVLSTTMLSFAFPGALAINPYFTEVFAQYFIQRQEVAYNLLTFHAQNAKPLSTAWAKQYILWKYC